MEVRAAAVLKGEKAAVVQVGPHEAVFGEAEAVAAVGLGAVAGGRVREVDTAAVADVIEQGHAVAVRIGRGLFAYFGGDGREHHILTRQAGRGVGTVFAELDEGVVALGRDFRDELGEAFAFRREVGVYHELGRGRDEARVEHARPEGRVLEDLTIEGDRGLHAADHVFGQGAVHDAEHFLPVAAIGDEKRTGGVVVRGELVPGGKVGVDAHAGAAGRHVAGNQAGVRGEVVLRVFAVDADLHGEVGRLGVFFGQAQLRAEGHGDLLFDEVDAVTAFGDAVFHLKAGVHFDEVGFTLRGDEELHRGEGVITHLADQHTGVFLQAFAQLGRDARPRGRGDFHELLVVALHGAVAFVKGEHVAVLVGDDLDFDVADLFEVLFHIQAGVAEGRLRHGGGLKKGIFQFAFFTNKENAAPASAALSLQHDGEGDFVDDLACGGHVDRAFRAGHHGDAEPLGDLADLHLVAEQVHGVGFGADEGDARLFAFLGEPLVFRREAPAGMDGDDTALLRLGDDEIEIKVRARIGTEQEQFLRGRSGRRGLVDVGGGHYGHCGEAFTDGPADSTCRNAPVGYEYGLAPNFVQYLFKRLGGHAFNLFNKEMFRPGKSRSCSGRTPKRHRGHL